VSAKAKAAATAAAGSVCLVIMVSLVVGNHRERKRQEACFLADVAKPPNALSLVDYKV
jgi:hypothetical protein